MRLLSAADLMRLLPMAATIEAVEAGFLAAGELPQRVTVDVGGAGRSLFMPGYLPECGALGLKVVSHFPGNVDRPSALGAVLLLDPASGEPQALLDGTWLTALRTGAATGVATRALARACASVACVLGAGWTAWHQLEAICAVRPIREVRLWNRTRERAVRLAERARAALDVTVRVCDSGREAVEGADVVACCTSSEEPVLRAAWLAPGAHVNAVGAFRPEMCEVEPEVARRAAVSVVDTPSALQTGDLAGLEAAATLAEVLRGTVPGRRADGELTLYKSVGFAALDLAVASLALSLARETGAGCQFELFSPPAG